MTQDEIDQIISDALAESKGSAKPSAGADRRRRIQKIRRILNTAFMLLFVATVTCYFIPGCKTAFFILGFTALIIKTIEFIIRFTA